MPPMEVLQPNADEAWLIARFASGQKADFKGRGGPPAGRPAIRAELLRQLILGQLSGPTGQVVVSPVGLHVKAAAIRGPLQLADASGSHGENACPPLVFEECRFESDDPWPSPEDRVAEPSIDLRHARCSRVVLADCELAMLALDDAWIGGDLDLSGLNAGEATPARQCWVRARGAHVAGTITLSRARLQLEQKRGRQTGAVLDYACDLRGARVDGNVDGFDGLRIAGGLALPQKVTGDVRLEGAELSCTTAPRNCALMAQACEVDGIVLFRPEQGATHVRACEMLGQVDLYGMHIGGSLAFTGVRFAAPALEPSDALLKAYLLTVAGSVFMNGWSPKQGAKVVTEVSGNAAIDFSGAHIGADLFIEFKVAGDHLRFGARGLRVDAHFRLDGALGSYLLPAMRIGGNLEIIAAARLAPTVDVSDCQVAGNLWLEGAFAGVRAWGAQVGGQFGGPDYHAAAIVGQDLRVRGASYFKASSDVDLRSAEFCAQVRVSSIAKVPGINLQGADLVAQRNLVIEGPVRALQLSAARVGGNLDAARCSVNTAGLAGIRVEGATLLPQHVFGVVSLVGGRFEASVHLEQVRLHVRRRPSGETLPKLDFTDAHIDGDLKVDRLERVPITGIIEEVGEAPPWVDQLDATDPAPLPLPRRRLKVQRRRPSFYEGAELIELHVPASDASAPADVTDTDAHAFLMLADGRTVYLNGESPPIHRINGLEGGNKPLRLDTPEQVEDYLRFFCGYVWGELGAFVIVYSLEESEWLRYLERDSERFKDPPVPPRVRREGEAWGVDAVVLYADSLYSVHFSVPSSGTVEMTEDVKLASMQPQGVHYPKPNRRYRMAWPVAADDAAGAGPIVDHPRPEEVEAPAHGSLHQVIADPGGWSTASDSPTPDDVARIRDALTTTGKRHVDTDALLPVDIDLRGCRCGSLEDGHGQGWGEGLTVDLRDFEYDVLAEGTSGTQGAANKAFTGPAKRDVDVQIGASLGRSRNAWLERVMQGLEFSVTPYEQMVRALARRGDQDAARTVLERRLRRENDRRAWGPRWCIRVFVQLPFRFGLFSLCGLVATLLYWLLGIVMFDVANYGQLRLPPIGAAESKLVLLRLPLPIRPVLVVDSMPVTMNVVSTAAEDKLVTARVPASDGQVEEMRCGDQVEASLYALDIMLPLVDLHQQAKCGISSSDGWGPFAWRIFRALYALGGAYMTSMLLLTLSGVLRRSIER